ncbi:MAG: ion transporter [Proteobacteria bacterium]|nr:MAG: ion transporter [Pseudomonadota bacterium]
MDPQYREVPARRAKWRKRIYIVIFGSGTTAGKLFDIGLLWSIVLSVICVLLESVPSVHAQYGEELLRAEWVFTALFSLEYILRFVSSPRPLLYAKSFFGLIDLISIIPSFLSLYIVGAQGLLVIRVIRLLRVFRILKMVQYIGESQILLTALSASRHKITVFIGTIMTLIVIFGSAMYLIEGPQNGFTSIPVSMYWAIVTMTTVGYGDITPLTAAGKILASIIMLMGYGILAVPTGIVSVELGKASQRSFAHAACRRCGEALLPVQSRYCFRCGEKLGE